MTDEEKAEEYANNEINKMFVDESEEVYVRASTLKQIIKNSHLKGLAEGRKEKWHEVADGDYPPCEKGNYTINVFTNSGHIAYYNYDDECWIAEPTSVEIDPPVAWCEIPKYEE